MLQDKLHNFINFILINTMKYFNTLIDTIFPKYCIWCGISGEYLCKTCKKQLYPHPEICPACHRFSHDYTLCINCKTDKKRAIEGIIIPFVYTAILKQIIIKIKYLHKKDLAQVLAQRIHLALQANEKFNTYRKKFPTYITRIPTHRYREYIIKWYNQSKILAKIVSTYTNIPRKAITKKTRATKAQAKLNRNQRLQNLKNAFSLLPKTWLQGNETILIIDDVTTTGSTINEVAKTIKTQYPHTHIRGLVIGRHM